MKHKKKYENKIIEKSKNTTPIRVLYKKTGQAPETKIIDNVFKLKKAIVKRKLEIIPYEKLYIICNNRKAIPLPPTKKPIKQQFTKVYERDIERDNSSKSNSSNFEKVLISLLFNIEMTLSTLLGNGDKK